MPTGNNIPFMPGDYSAESYMGLNGRSGEPRKSTVGARPSDGAPNFTDGLAGNTKTKSGLPALQRAAKRRLSSNVGSKAPGTATYKRNSERQ